MKAILLDAAGFRKEVDTFERTPTFEVSKLEGASFRNRPISPLEAIPVTTTTFHFVRSFVNEYDQEILIYKERP